MLWFSATNNENTTVSNLVGHEEEDVRGSSRTQHCAQCSEPHHSPDCHRVPLEILFPLAITLA
jgi:hypothetical protein